MCLYWRDKSPETNTVRLTRSFSLVCFTILTLLKQTKPTNYKKTHKRKQKNSCPAAMHSNWRYWSVWCACRQAHIQVCWMLQSSISPSTVQKKKTWVYATYCIINVALRVPKDLQEKDINVNSSKDFDVTTSTLQTGGGPYLVWCHLVV